MYDELDAVFHVRGKKGVVFTFGDAIYVPDGHPVAPALQAHEEVHCARQPDPASWWRRYIDDPEFRLAEEIPAHRAEYRFICNEYRDRNLRAQLLHALANRLSGPLYGSLIKASDARRMIGA